MDIDFVIMWVDGSDPAWLAEKKKYTPTEEADDRDERYRDWNLLKYWFRGVEKYAPWVRKIHFVTWGHVPSWLDTDNDKLHIVKHEDFIPEEVRPLFNSSSIECHLHKIPDLAEHFVLFNDDLFITNKVDEKDFFRKGLPCDLLAFQPVIANPDNPVMSHMLLNDSIIISKHFKKEKMFGNIPVIIFILVTLRFISFIICLNYFLTDIPVFIRYMVLHLFLKGRLRICGV